MKKKLALVMAMVILASVLTACTGTPVIYMTNCTCPEGAHDTGREDAPVIQEGALKTGLAIVTGLSKSANAEEGKNGKVSYDITFAAVTVDEAGVIRECVLDSIACDVGFDGNGMLSGDVSSPVLTKNALGEAYGMKAKAGSKYEWNEQAAALAEYAEGKTVEELRNGAVNESGKAADADLASKATIYIGGYVSAIEAAVKNAENRGAMIGDELKMAVSANVSSSASASSEKAGSAQLNADCVVVTVKEGKITGCTIDSLQAKAAFDAQGKITSDLSAKVSTKNELGEAYGMKIKGSKFEWNEQARALADYVKGKTAQEVLGIAVNEKTAPSDTDLSSTVTIAIGGYKTLIAEAAE